jgi:hypothetical protein
VLPFLVYFLLKLVGVSPIWIYITLSMIVSSTAIVYAFYVFIWILKQDEGTQEMQDIA